VRRVTVRDCEFSQTATLFHPICWREGFANRGFGSSGGLIEDISIKDIQYYNHVHRDNMWYRSPIDFDMYYTAGPLDNPDFDTHAPLDEHTPYMRNIVLENISIVDISDRYGITMIGRPETNISNVLLRNVQCISKYGMRVINADGVIFENLYNGAISTLVPPDYRDFDVVFENLCHDSALKQAYEYINCQNLETHPNLVTNPGFEEGNVKWELFDTRIFDKRNAWPDVNGNCTGTRTLKLFSLKSFARQYIAITNLQGTKFILSARGKVSEKKISGKVILSAIDSKNNRLEGFEATIVFTDTCFLTKESSVSIPPEAAALCLEIRADGNAFYVDDVGLFASPRVSTQSFNDDAPCFKYSEDFIRIENSRQSYCGDVHQSESSNGSFTFAFTGKRAKLYGMKSPESGRVVFSVDGNTAKGVGIFAEAEQPGQLWFDTGELKNGDHVIKVNITASSPNKSKAKTSFDYAYVISEK
jgi:hypothetical protein